MIIIWFNFYILLVKKLYGQLIKNHYKYNFKVTIIEIKNNTLYDDIHYLNAYYN